MRRDVIKNPVPGRIGFGGNRWRWLCTECGFIADWSRFWSWHGSIIEAESNRFDWVACSAKCAKALSKKHGTPLVLAREGGK